MVAYEEIANFIPALTDLLDIAKGQYHQLIIWALPPINFDALQQVGIALEASVINLNLELSRRLLELSQRQWSHKIPALLSDIFNSAGPSAVLLNHIELLFSKTLQVDPLRCLQQIARHQPVIVIWPGKVNEQHFFYAEPGHPDYVRYPRKDYLIFSGAL